MANSPRLQNATSPYLQQHADNPVNWYPWGEEAIQTARRENKPILLSIGYFACHWCHVMAHESFADSKTAEIMNKYFINIKVDREERPDLDRIYQLAHQLLTGRGGGWPLTVFLTPHDLVPFFAGTYFPPKPHYGMPSFSEVLLKTADYFERHANEISEQNKYLKDALMSVETPSFINQELNNKPLSDALNELRASFDKMNGGFGGAPKFPPSSALDYLLYEGDQYEMARFTLLKMAKGGIYDQLGGGFFRYSVDAKWQIPHFEKMLYDNAQLLSSYSQAGLIQQESHFTRVVEGTINWLLEEMQAPEGGFYSAIDADSQHIEGKYYYWDQAEVKQLLTKEEYQATAAYYGLNRPPNFEKYWHLTINNENITNSVLESAKRKLLIARRMRVRPGRDEKILTSWNALLIKGIGLTSRYLKRDNLLITAEKIVNFIHNNLWKENKLYACYRNGQVYQIAYLDDYAFLLEALLHMLQLRWNTDYLNFAVNLAEALIANYYDNKDGGFFYTPHNYEPLICRSKPFIDNVIPSGNGIAALALARLGFLLGETRYLHIAEKTLLAASPSLKSHPSLHGTLLKSLAEYFDPPEIHILRGSNMNLKAAKELYFKEYIPRRLIFAIPSTENNLPPNLKFYTSDENKVVHYVCKGRKCEEKTIIH